MNNAFEWKSFHSEILFSMLNPLHQLSSPDLLKDFLRFAGIEGTFENLELSINENQSILLIQDKKQGILIENNLDEYSDCDKELLRFIDECISEYFIKILLIVSIHWKEKDEIRHLPREVNSMIHNLTANEVASFFDDWCNKQKEKSLAKVILTNYSKKLREEPNGETKKSVNE